MGAPGETEVGVQSRPRAVVWWPRAGESGVAGGVANRSLLESLNKRGADPIGVESELWAMAHACKLGSGTLLVLCEPMRLSGAAHVVLALRKYSPGVVVYAFEPGTAQMLRPVVDQDLVDWGAPGKPLAEPVRAAPPRVNGKPMLRLTGDEEPRPIGPSLPITEHVASASDVLSADELAMLLGRSGSKDTDGPGRNGGGGNAKGDRR